MTCPTKIQLCPLHTHTVYSVLDGASTIDEYVDWCVQNGAQAIGTTDHGWAIGALETYVKAKKAGISALPGCEFYVVPDASYKFNGKPYDYYHVTAWAVGPGDKGYRNLIKLASLAWQEGTVEGGRQKKDGSLSSRVVSMWGGRQLKPRITFDELFQYNEGLVLGTGCLIGAVNKALLNGEFSGAERNLLRLLDVYKGRVFAEIMPHACDHNYSRDSKKFEPNPPLSFDECKDFSPDGKLQVACNSEIIRLARKHRIPLLMTIDSHFVKPEQKRLQDVLLSTSDDGWTFYESYHMYDTPTAWDAWQKLHGSDVEQQKIFTEAVEGNAILAGLAKDLEIKDGYHQPEPIIPDGIAAEIQDPKEQRRATILAHVAKHGRMKWDNPVWLERLDRELKVICDNGIIDFSPYFLFLEKTGDWAAANSIFSAPGRGSGAGSLLCYLLKITHLDPIAWNLPFERFLSQARLERGKFPDIDWDTGSRDVLIAKLREEYGDKMAQCSTLGTLKLKSAIKDACRAILGWNAQDERVESITKTIPNEPQGVPSKDFLLGYKDQDGAIHDGHIHENARLDQFFRDYPQVYDAVIQLLGIPRSVGRHASAFLISDRPISESVPTCMISGHLCTQYQATASNNMVEKAGLIKFDFLRVNTLDDVSSTIRAVQQKYGHKVWEERLRLDGEEYKITRGDLGIDQLPMPDGTVLNVYDLPEDERVFEELSDGRTETVFQMNSALMTEFTKRIRPTKLQHLSDIVALVRPGPLLASVGERDDEGRDLTMTEAYIARKNGLRPVKYAHPGMEAILKDTYGVAVYQEDLQRMFVDLAGYSQEEADYLRETLAKKKRQEMEKALPDLRRRLEARGWRESQIEVFVSLCVASSAYSFNRAHSAAYATVAYQCAFLKHHFPIEWWTSVLQNAKVEDIREKGYARVLQERGLLQPPSINGPTDTFRSIDGKVYAPLYLIDRVGDIACKAISDARDAGGPFQSLQDFFERVDSRSVNEGIVHNLILCGAFSEVEPDATEQELIHQYHYLRKVSSLKIGAGAKGAALRSAVDRYKEKERQAGKQLEIPTLFVDRLQTEIARVAALPIYKIDVHHMFPEFLQEKLHLSYGKNSYGDPICTLRHKIRVRDENFVFDERIDTTYVYRGLQDINLNHRSGTRGGFAGLVQDFSTFQYTDKRRGCKVTALKMQIVNDGDVIEAVVWPDLYQEVGDPKKDRIILVTGSLKESREPGKWEMSVSAVQYA